MIVCLVLVGSFKEHLNQKTRIFCHFYCSLPQVDKGVIMLLLLLVFRLNVMWYTIIALLHCEEDKDKKSASELIPCPWRWVKKASAFKRKVINTLCTLSQLCTKYPSVPPVTSWYLHAMWTYRSIEGRRDEERRGGEMRGNGGDQGVRDKLAKPLRWFQLKLAILPVGSINSQLPETLTSMGQLSPSAPESRRLPSLSSVCRRFSPPRATSLEHQMRMD